MEVDAPKAPFPLKRLLRESLSQIAWGLVLLAIGGSVVSGWNWYRSGHSINLEWLLTTSAIAGVLIAVAAPVLILDWLKAYRARSRDA